MSCRGSISPTTRLLPGTTCSPYLDTQINRFGSANFHQLPINQSRAPVNNYQQDSSMRYANRPGKVNYEPNSLGGNAAESPASEGGFVSYPEPVSGVKVRGRSPSFGDHFSARRRCSSRVSPAPEQAHVDRGVAVRARQGQDSPCEAAHARVARQREHPPHSGGCRRSRAPGAERPRPTPASVPSPALSQAHTVFLPTTRKVAILTADGVDASDVAAMRRHLGAAGVSSDVIAPHEGAITAVSGATVPVTASIITVDAVQYDALFLPAGAASVRALRSNGDAVYFIEETYKYYKSIAATGDARQLLPLAIGDAAEPGIVTGAR